MRQGRNARLPIGKASDNVRPRSAAAAAPRRGMNSKKGEDIRRTKRRARRIGALRRAWVGLRTSIIAVVVAVGLGAVGWAGYKSFQSNSFLVLRQVDVVGNHLVAKAAILEKAGLELGVKLPSVSVGNVENSLLTLPGVGEVEVRRIFPSRIEIRVREKEPVAMGYAKGWYGLAPDGTQISGLDWGESDLPVVDGFASLDSTRRIALGGFLEAAKETYPTLYSNFSQLTMRGNVFEIILRDGRLKLLLGMEPDSAIASTGPKGVNIDANKSLNSLELLQALMQQQSSALEPGKTVDLRVEGYAYVH